MIMLEARIEQGAPDRTETPQVAPDAVTARVDELLDAGGYSTGRKNKALIITDEDGSSRTLKTLSIPDLEAYDDWLHPSTAFGVRANNVLITRMIVPIHGAYSGVQEIGSISELRGEYDGRTISISALRFKDGTQNVVFPAKFKGKSVTEPQKIEMARALGVKV